MLAVLIGFEAIERLEDIRSGVCTDPEELLEHETEG